MLKILFVTAFPPNTKTAGQNYSRQLLEDLSSDYDVEVCYWGYPEHDVELSEKIKCSEMPIDRFLRNRMLLKYFPIFSKRYSKRALHILRKKAENADILYFDFSQVFIYSKFINHPFKIGMSHDVIAQKYSRLPKYKPFMPWVRWSEKHLLRSVNNIFTFSTKDCDAINFFYNLPCSTVPFYLEDNLKSVSLSNCKIEDYFIMYGAWNRKENEESLEWVIKNYDYNFPKLRIIGGGLSDYYISLISKIPNMEYIGFVENPYPLIAKSKGLIAPLFHGAGVKVKAIEALALGTPVLGTEVTFEGLPDMHQDVLIRLTNQTALRETISKLLKLTSEIKLEIQNEFNEKYIQRTFKEQLNSLIK